MNTTKTLDEQITELQKEISKLKEQNANIIKSLEVSLRNLHIDLTQCNDNFDYLFKKLPNYRSD